MAFNSFQFWVLFPFIFVIYWLIPAKWNQCRKIWLILVSYLLYMNWKPAYALILLAVSIVTYFGGIILDKQTGLSSRRNRLVWLFSLLGLMPLLIFKYYNFLNTSLSAGLDYLGLQFSLPGLNWAVPIGISFFSFQSVGYMLDVYHFRVRAEHSLTDYLLFVCFFPQIASGPISKAEELLPQIKASHFFNYSQSVTGLRYLLWGMFLKVVVADRLGVYVDSVFHDLHVASGASCFLTCVFYSFQIYADFAGYSFMAVGLAKTLGFDLINNFCRPYLSASVTDFWHRWHISLSRWLTQQVYIPLGGNRCGKSRMYLNVSITFLICGIWHGASYTFIVWGLLHALFLIIEKSVGWNKEESKGILRILHIVITFAVVTIAWVFFRCASISEALSFFERFFNASGSSISMGSGVQLLYCILALVPLLFYEILAEFKLELYNRVMGMGIFRWVAYLTLFTAIILVGVLDGSSFIYVGY